MRAALLLLLLLASPAHAACPNESEVFSCTIKGKPLQICHWKGALIYNFGPEDTPELSIAEPLETIEYTPWSGFGRNRYHSVLFHNNGFTYEVWSGFDRIGEARVVEGGINVEDGGTTLARLECDLGSAAPELEVISDLKSAIGQCWVFESQSWAICP